MKGSFKGVVCGIALITVGGLAFAEFATPGDAIRYRKAVMTVIGDHFGRIAAVVTGKTPYEAKAVDQDTVVLQTLSELPWEAFMVPGSEKGGTTLKASAMKERDKFMAIAQEFEGASKKLAETAKSGDLKAMGAQFGEVSKTCKSCHMTYRNL